MPRISKSGTSLIDSLPSKPKIAKPENPRYTSRAELVSFAERIIAHKRLGEALKAAREHQGLSTRDLAKRADLSHTRIQAIESANETLEIQTMTRVADALGYHVNVQFIPNAENAQRSTFGVLLSK